MYVSGVGHCLAARVVDGAIVIVVCRTASTVVVCFFFTVLLLILSIPEHSLLLANSTDIFSIGSPLG